MKTGIAAAVIFLGTLAFYLFMVFAFPGCIMVGRFTDPTPVIISGNRDTVVTMRDRGKYRIAEMFIRENGKWRQVDTDTIGTIEEE